MELILTIIRQVIIMFILAGVGYVMFKTGKISKQGSKSIGNILIYLSLPCVIINSFLVEKSQENLQGLLISAIVALIVLILFALISRLVLGRNAIENFSGSFSNPGFFGIPLIVASLAEGSVFYVAAFIAFLNLGQWTYGVSLLKNSDENGMLPKKGEKSAKGKEKGTANIIKELLIRLIKAPFMIAIIIGLFFFFTGISMPDIPAKCITNIANLNTPLAMFTIGIYMAQTDIAKMFIKPRLYLLSFVRMILCPIAALAILYFVPPYMYDLKMAILIAAACPVGSNVAVYAQLHNKDYTYAVETVVISTILSIVTIPLVVAVAQLLWQA